MKTTTRQSRLCRVSCLLAAAIVATAGVPAADAAEPLPIYGGPTYSPSAGGYLASGSGPNMPGLSPTAHVNDAGTVAATTHRLSSSGSSMGLRAVRWSASSPFVELGGNPDSHAEGINSAGTVIGEIGSGQSDSRGPARWSGSSTAATPLEHPPVVGHPNGWRSPFLSDLNDAGTAIGTVWRTGADENGPVDLGTRPARWGGSGTALTELGLLRANAEGLQSGGGRAINLSGVAVGYSGKNHPDGSSAGWRAVRWDASGVVATELGDLGTTRNYGQYPDGWTESYAFAVNSAGTAVGYGNVYDDEGQLLRQHAPVRWDPSGTATELGKLSANGSASVAWSPATLNDAGTAVGWSLRIRDDGVSLGRRAVRWDASGTAATELGNLGTFLNITESQAFAVNAAGTAVGFAEAYSPTGAYFGEHAVYWGEDALAIDLNTLIDPAGGWVLNRALAISDTGWIAGNGMFDPDGAGGQAAYSRHFLMHVPATVPEPTTGLTIAMGAFALLRRGRRNGAGATAPRSPNQRKRAVKNPSSVFVLAATACIAGGASISLGDELMKLTPSDAVANQAFGESVALSGNTAIIGSRADHSAGDYAGSAYLFDLSTGRQLPKLFASDAERHDGFGVAVAIGGGTAIVGASGDDFASGAAYLFDTTTGAQLSKLTASDAAANQIFGRSVAINGNTALVGAPRNADWGLRSAYLFDVASGQELFKLSPTDLYFQFGGFFGISVAISGNTAVIGAPGDDEAGSNSGSVYVFDVTTGQQRFKLTASDASGNLGLGQSVAINGNIAIVGAPGDDHAGAESGSA